MVQEGAGDRQCVLDDMGLGNKEDRHKEWEVKGRGLFEKCPHLIKKTVPLGVERDTALLGKFGEKLFLFGR